MPPDTSIPTMRSEPTGARAAAEVAEVREELRRDLEWTAQFIARHGHPFRDARWRGADADEEPDAA
jgi:hypothetical protein